MLVVYDVLQLAQEPRVNLGQLKDAVDGISLFQSLGNGKDAQVGGSESSMTWITNCHPTDLRVFAIAEALEKGYAIDRIFELTKIDPWFLGKLKNIVDYEAENFPNIIRWKTITRRRCCAKPKCLGFSDFQIARFVLNPQGTNMEKENLAVRARTVRSWASCPP